MIYGMYKVTSSDDYLHRISELTGVPMSTLRVLTDYLKLAVCHDIYNAIQIDSHDNEDTTVNLATFGELTIKCDPITTELSYSIDLSKTLSKMIKDVYDRNYSPLTAKVEDSVIRIFTEKFDNLGLMIEEDNK